MSEKFRELHNKYVPMEPRGRRPRQAARPGLSEVYQQAGLPPTGPPKQLPPGERWMLEERKLSDFVQELHRPVTAAQAIASKTHRSS